MLGSPRLFYEVSEHSNKRAQTRGEKRLTSLQTHFTPLSSTPSPANKRKKKSKLNFSQSVHSPNPCQVQIPHQIIYDAQHGIRTCAPSPFPTPPPPSPSFIHPSTPPFYPPSPPFNPLAHGLSCHLFNLLNLLISRATDQRPTAKA